MARLVGPDDASRLAYRIRTGDRALLDAAGLTTTVYSDAAGTVLADIRTQPGGATIAGSALTIGADSLIPLFQFPDGVDTVYARVGGGAPYPLYARTDDRLDLLGASFAVFNVRQYGATGDGSTNDTAAIQAAINAVPTLGGVVYFPAGQYKITAAITVRSRLRLVGDGDAASIITQTSTSADGFTGVDVDRLTFTGLKILGPGSGTGTGINLTRSANPATSYTSATDVYVASWGKDGVAISNPIVSRFERVISETNGNHGFNLYGVSGGAAGTSCALVACYGNGNTQAGIRLFNMVYCALSACGGDANGIGYLIDSCQGVSIEGSGAESTTNKSVSYPGTSFKVVNSVGVDIGAVWVYRNAEIGIYVTGSSRAVSLTNCVENTPIGGAVNFIKVDAGCGVVMTACSNTTANSLAGGTTQTLDDGTGGMALRTYLYATTTVSAELDVTSFNGNLITSLAGKGVRVKEGTAAKMGTGTLAAGTVTVANTSVTANSRVFLTAQVLGGTAGALRVDSRVPGTSFTVKSTSASDTSTFAYFIVEPS